MALPWSLSIVDCYFLAAAFKACCAGHEVIRLDNYENDLVSSPISFPGVYEIYGVDRDGGDIDQALIVGEREEFCFLGPVRTLCPYCWKSAVSPHSLSLSGGDCAPPFY